MARIDPIDDVAAQANLAELDHLFVVMMENRSFDHMLGYRRLRGFDADLDGLDPAMGERVGPTDAFFPVSLAPGTAFDDDPPHNHAQTLDALEEGFANRYLRALQNRAASGDRGVPAPGTAIRALEYHDETHVPMLHQLANEFCVCDRWFSSSSGSTWANRLFLYYGRSGGAREVLDNVDELEFDDRRRARKADRDTRDEALAGLEGRDRRTARRDDRKDDRDARKEDRQDETDLDTRKEYFANLDTPSLFDLLDEADAPVPWRVYHAGAIAWPRLLPRQRPRFGSNGYRPLSALDQDLRQRGLPKVVFVDPDHAGPNQSNDLAPIDLLAGQRFLRDVYQRLAEAPEVFSRSALVVMYDEHGGFYDHVDPRDFLTGDGGSFRHYGVRVPAVVAGGRIPRGSLSSTVFDHTSVMATAIRAFAPDQVTRMPARAQRAKHVGHLMVGEPRTSFPAPVEVPRPPRRSDAPTANAFQGWAALAGVR